MTKAKTLSSGSIDVWRGSDGAVAVKSAKVTRADVLAGNGVIHVIDRVVL